MTLKDLIVRHKDELSKYARKKAEITADTVFQKGNKELQDAFDRILLGIMKNDSRVIASENLFELSEKASSGKRCLILPEHYSNFDYPIITALFKSLGDKGKKLSSQCVAMAGVKLSEESDAISMFTDAYDSIFVYPSRTLKKIKDPKKLEAEMHKARSINLASMRKMEELRKEGRIVVVFPTGTRYRPGKPETKKAIREIDSYIKTSDYMVLLSINGNCLEVNPSDDMTLDLVKEDTIILEASKLIDCKAFRSEVLNTLNEGEDKKQCIADEIMRILERMHENNI